MQVLCGLHAPTRLRVGYMHACVVNQYLGVVGFTECVNVETELKFNTKLQEANVDRSKGGGKLRASQPR